MDILAKPLDPFKGVKIFERLSGAEAARAEAQSAQNIANFNAAVAEQQAKAERIRAGFAAKRQAKRGEQIKSKLRAALGKTGARIDVGTALAVEEEQAAELELENLLIGFEGEVLARRAMTQAELDRLSGRLAIERGRNLAAQRNVQFAATLLTGFA